MGNPDNTSAKIFGRRLRRKVRRHRPAKVTKLLRARKIPDGSGHFHIGDCGLCGRHLGLGAANRIGVICDEDGSQYDRQGNFLYHAASSREEIIAALKRFNLPLDIAPKPVADIRIHVKGGNVQDVDGIPPGVRVRIIDCDGEGDEDWAVKLDKRDAAFAGQKRANVGIYEAE